MDDEVSEVCDAEAALGRLALVASAVVKSHILDYQTPARNVEGIVIDGGNAQEK